MRVLVQIGEDVSGAGVVLAALTPGAELADGHEEVDVVGAYEVLGHVDDCGAQTHFPVVVGGVFGHVPLQLGHFQFRPQVPFETREQDLPLSRLQPVHHRRNRPHVRVHCVVDHLFVHKLTVPNPVQCVVDETLRIVVRKPLLTLVRFFTVEKQVDFLLVLHRLVLKAQTMLLYFLKVLHRFLVR